MSCSAQSGRVLVIEDEPSIVDAIVYALENEGFQVTTSGTGKDGLALAKSNSFALIILDVGLPDQSGFDVCRELRRRSTIPVIFLTARTAEIDRVVGLELGGDDYLAKPFSPRELVARVRAILRRTAITAEAAPDSSGDSQQFQVDDERCQIHYCGKILDLGRYEYRLLCALIAQPGRVFSRAQLMDAAWEEPEASMERTVDTHIKSLRAKMKKINSKASPIVTHRGLGYSLETKT